LQPIPKPAKLNDAAGKALRDTNFGALLARAWPDD